MYVPVAVIGTPEVLASDEMTNPSRDFHARISSRATALVRRQSAKSILFECSECSEPLSTINSTPLALDVSKCSHNFASFFS